MSPVSLWLLTGHSLSLQNSSNPDKSSSSEIIKVHRVRTKSWILTKVLNFIQLFFRPGKSEENGWSLEKMKKVLSFFLSYNKCFISDLFFLCLLFFLKNLFQRHLYVCRAPWKKLCSFTCLIKLWVWKKKFLFCKKVWKTFSILDPKIVRTLNC